MGMIRLGEAMDAAIKTGGGGALTVNDTAEIEAIPYWAWKVELKVESDALVMDLIAVSIWARATGSAPPPPPPPLRFSCGFGGDVT